MFDRYSLRARVYPVLLVFSPILVLGAFYSYEYKSLTQIFGSGIIVGLLTYLSSQLGRDRGKKKERELWNSWGGSPSVQILRLRDANINKHTKQRYHQKLQTLCPVNSMPNEGMEAASPDEADEVYSAWCKYLITHTRDESKFPLVIKDLTSYGFRRNLWGLKLFGVLLTILLLFGNYFFWVAKLHACNPLGFPISFQYSSIALAIILLFWLSIVNRNWIKVVAFSYAERLCESIELL